MQFTTRIGLEQDSSCNNLALGAWSGLTWLKPRKEIRLSTLLERQYNAGYLSHRSLNLNHNRRTPVPSTIISGHLRILQQLSHRMASYFYGKQHFVTLKGLWQIDVRLQKLLQRQQNSDFQSHFSVLKSNDFFSNLSFYFCLLNYFLWSVQ